MTAKQDQARRTPTTIGVAVDFSETSALAFERACDVASIHGATLLVVHVLPSAPMAVHGVRPALSSADLAGRIRTLAERELARLVSAAGEKGVEAESVLAVGAPGRELVDVAIERGADLIVIGTRGLTGLAHLVLGSTAEYVVRHAPCAVLTVHPDDRGSLAAPRRVLVPVGLHDDPGAVGTEMRRVLGPAVLDASVLLVYSDHLPAYLQPWMGELGIDQIGLEEIRGRLEEDLAPAADALRALGFEVELVVSEGEPATVVGEIARTREADLVAMGTHGRTGAAHLLLGSVAERVVQNAACPVLTVRRDDEGAEGR
jgi:nucleotide-binding universal stress UspA family protein